MSSAAAPAVNGAHHDAESQSHIDARFSELERIVTAHGHKLQSSQPGLPASGIHRRLALPIPLAAYSIGATTWLLGLLLLNARGTTLPNAWYICGLPMGFFFNGLAGIGEIFTGNTFGCALFLSVAGIVLGLATPFLPWTSIASGVAVANQGNLEETLAQVNGASGVYLLVIFGVLFMLLIGAQRTAVAFVLSLVWINIVVVTFGIGLMTGNAACVTTAGAFLIIVSLNLFYNGTALLLLEVGHPLGPYLKLGSLAPAPSE